MARTGVSPRWSEGAVFLYERGIRIVDIAARLEVSTSRISHMLRGHQAAKPELFDAVVSLAGPDAADELRVILTRTARVAS